MFRKLTVAVATSFLLVACATEADQGAVEVRTGAATVDALRAVPDAAASETTGQWEMVMEVSFGGETMEMVATGAYDDAAGQSSMSMDMGDLFGGMPAGEEIPLDLGDGTMDLVVDGDTIYVRSGLFSMFTGTTGWLSASAEEMGADAGDLGMGFSDPGAIVESLRGTSGEPEVVGTEEVRGVATTRYRATLDLADALAEVPEAERAEVEAAFEELGEVGDAALSFDVWVDDDGLPRRLQLDLGQAFAGAEDFPSDAAMTFTIEMFGYGEPVEIEIPPADEVTPISESMGGLEGLFGS